MTVSNHTGNIFLNAKSVSDGRDPQGGLSTDVLFGSLKDLWATTEHKAGAHLFERQLLSQEGIYELSGRDTLFVAQEGDLQGGVGLISRMIGYTFTHRSDELPTLARDLSRPDLDDLDAV